MPWLWAITSKFSEELVVDVSVLNTGSLGQFLEFNGDQWWMRIESGDDQYVVALEGSPESPLGGRILAALNALHSNFAWGKDERVAVTHLVVRNRGGDIFVLRPQQGVSIKAACLKLVGHD
ncbi:MAG: hypothetical protein V4682_02130 [Patescibacteria group bacterium]